MSDYQTELFNLGIIAAPFNRSMRVLDIKQRTIQDVQFEQIKSSGLKVDISKFTDPQKEQVDKTLEILKNINEQNKINMVLLNKQIESLSLPEKIKAVNANISSNNLELSDLQNAYTKLLSDNFRPGEDNAVLKGTLRAVVTNGRSNDENEAMINQIFKDELKREDKFKLVDKIKEIIALLKSKEEMKQILDEKLSNLQFERSKAARESLGINPPLQLLNEYDSPLNVKAVDNKMYKNVLEDLTKLKQAGDKFFTPGRIEQVLTDPLENPIFTEKGKTNVDTYAGGPKRGVNPYPSAPLSYTGKLKLKQITVKTVAANIKAGSFFDTVYNIVIKPAEYEKYMKIRNKDNPELKDDYIFK